VVGAVFFTDPELPARTGKNYSSIGVGPAPALVSASEAARLVFIARNGVLREDELVASLAETVA